MQVPKGPEASEKRGAESAALRHTKLLQCGEARQEWRGAAVQDQARVPQELTHKVQGCELLQGLESRDRRERCCHPCE